MKLFSTLFLLSLAILVSLARRQKKSDRYGYDSFDSYGGGSDHSYGGGDSFGDLLSEYSSDYGLDQYGGAFGDHYGSYGGGYGSHATLYETEFSGGYGKPKMSYKRTNYKPKIQFKKSYEMLGLYGKGSGKQYNVRVPQDDSPVKVMFLTQNTPVHIQQKHKKGQPEYKKATTHEEPHVVVHEVIKPVIQEIREIIVPYRKVIQKIEPVQEERKTIVHKDDDKHEESGKSYGGSSGDNKYLKSYEREKYQDNIKDRYESDRTYGLRAEELKTSYKNFGNDKNYGEDDKYKESRLITSTAALEGALGNTGLTLAAIFGQKSSEEHKS